MSLPISVVAAAVVAILLWSGTAIANKIAVAHMDSMTAGVLRSMLAGFMSVVVVFAARIPRPDTRRRWGLLFLSGASSFAIWPMFLSAGLGLTSANHAALILAMLPVFTGLIIAIVERQRPRLGWWLGVAIAVAGSALLVTQRNIGDSVASDRALLGDLIILLGTVICAGGYVIGARLSPVIGGWGTTFWGLAMALVLLVPTFVFLAPRTEWTEVGAAGWSAIAYMTILSSLVGYAAWFWALGRGGIARIGAWQFMQPVLTVGWAALFLGERVTVLLVIAALAILAGTAMAQASTR